MFYSPLPTLRQDVENSLHVLFESDFEDAVGLVNHQTAAALVHKPACILGGGGGETKEISMKNIGVKVLNTNLIIWNSKKTKKNKHKQTWATNAKTRKKTRWEKHKTKTGQIEKFMGERPNINSAGSQHTRVENKKHTKPRSVTSDNSVRGGSGDKQNI